MKKLQSEIPVRYITLKLTRSRIEKGLLAIPVSLLDYFPKSGKQIFVMNEKNKPEAKTFTPYTSSSRECRIGGMRDFFTKYNLKDGDEVVIQKIDERLYRIIPETLFKDVIRNHLENFRKGKHENELKYHLDKAAEWAHITAKELMINQFVFLSRMEIPDRNYKPTGMGARRESVPLALREILGALYEGKCQVTGFTFLTKNGKPYFEIHHIIPEKGNHVKNLLVVSPNTHAQFTYAHLKQIFDKDGWLRKVQFNEEKFDVFQIIDKLDQNIEKEIHFME